MKIAFISKPCGLPRWFRGIKNPPVNAGDMGLIPRTGRFPGAGNGNPLQYFARKIPRTEEPGRL